MADQPSSSKPQFVPLSSRNEREEQGFSQAFVYVWTPDPTRDRVRVILDDGLIKMSLSRDKFIELLSNVIEANKPGVDYSFFKIRESVMRYGGWFFYDRIGNDFRELGERVDNEVIRPIDLLNESRKGLVKEKLHEQFQNLNKVNTEIRKFRMDQPRSISDRFNSMFQVLRNFQKSKH